MHMRHLWGLATDILQYSRFLGPSTPPTPLWNRRVIREKSISVTIDNTSIFVPGSSTPQYGFRRTELIAQNATGGDRGAFVDALESGNTTFHFSIKADTARPLNYTHEYQIVFIEPSDGSHVFGVQLGAPLHCPVLTELNVGVGSPFTNPTGPLPVKNARHFKVLDHAWNTLFHTQFLPHVWHNFAVRVDWDNLTLQVFYSVESLPLVPVTKVVDNLSVKKGPEGKGDFHIGVLKVCIAYYSVFKHTDVMV